MTIIIYLSVVGALLLYMLFLLLIDPLIRKHDPYTMPLQNEEDSEVCENDLRTTFLCALKLTVFSKTFLSKKRNMEISLVFHKPSARKIQAEQKYKL